MPDHLPVEAGRKRSPRKRAAFLHEDPLALLQPEVLEYLEPEGVPRYRWSLRSESYVKHIAAFVGSAQETQERDQFDVSQLQYGVDLFPQGFLLQHVTFFKLV